MAHAHLQYQCTNLKLAAHCQPQPRRCLGSLASQIGGRCGAGRACGAGGRLLCRAGNGDSEAFSTQLSLPEAYSLLGLPEGASYEAVVSAKNKLRARFEGQEAELEKVDSAYDAIFSSQLKARLSGSLPVSNKVRFADVAAQRRPAPPKTLSLPAGASVSVRPLPPQPAGAAAAVFAALAAWTLGQGLLAPSPASAAADVPGIQLGLGLAAAVYVLRESKKAGLAKSFGLAVGGLVGGTLVGSLAESWLRVDIVPLGALASPGALVGEFGLAGLFAACFFLA